MFHPFSGPASPAQGGLYQPAAGGSLPQRQNGFSFQDIQGASMPQGFTTSEGPYSYPYAQETENTIASNSFEWHGAPQYDNDRQMGQPPRPPQPGFDSLERRVRQLERQQDRFDRELNRIDRRLRIIERRLGIPIPPVPFPGTPPR